MILIFRTKFIKLSGSADIKYEVLSLAPTGNIRENNGAHQTKIIFEMVKLIEIFLDRVKYENKKKEIIFIGHSEFLHYSLPV